MNSKIFFFFVFGFWFSVLGLANANEIHGRISIEPPYPELKVIEVKKKRPDQCAHEQVSQTLIVSKDGYVKNAVVSLKGDFPEKFEGKTVLDQKNCNFEPHVILVPQGRPFWVSNSDPMAHDVRAFDGAQMLFRFEMNDGDKPVLQQFDKAGVYTLRCGLHHWMHGGFQ